MENLLFILALGLIAAKITGYVKVSWTIVIIAVAVPIVLSAFGGFRALISQFSFGGGEKEEQTADACGCFPGQFVAAKKNRFLRRDIVERMTCQEFQGKGRRWSIVGCLN